MLPQTLPQKTNLHRLYLPLCVVAVIALPGLLVAEQDTAGDTAVVNDSDTEDTDKPFDAAEESMGETPSPASRFQADPTLLSLRDDLRSLAGGQAPAAGEIDTLFNVRLDEPKKIAARLATLPEEITRLDARAKQALRDASEVEKLEPKVERPADLDAALTAPTPPIAPSPPPEKPPRGATAKDYNGESPKAYYKRVLAEHEEKVAAYKQAQITYTEAQAAYEAAVKARAEKEAAFQAGKAARAERVKKAESELRSEAASASLRLEIARLRRNYLTAAAELLGRFPEPALTAFQSLDQKRAALRSRSAALRTLQQRATDLLARVRRLRDRAASGALLGFQVQQEDLAKALEGDIRGLEERVEKAGSLADALEKTATELETEGAAAQKDLLASALRPDRNAFLDEAFFTALRRTRKAAKTQVGTAVSDAEISDVEQALSKSLRTPAAISAVADAETALRESRAAVERLDKILDTAFSSADRHIQAFARELVTVYGAQASDAAKSRAYSLSASLLEDFTADLLMIRSELSLWLESRTAALSDVPDAIQSSDGRMRIVRTFGGILIALLLLTLRRPIRKRLSRVLIRLARRRTFRRRAGTLVRLAVFLAALIPTLLTAAAGYTLLALIGFDYPEVRIAEVALRWTVLYFLTRQVLHGLTQREARGRPPLIEMLPNNAKLLSKTYARLGLFLALMAAVHEWTTEWLGTGSLSMVVRLLAAVWLGGWTLWALFAWRKPLALSCTEISPENSRRRAFAEWIGSHFVGVLATPILLLWRIPSTLLKSLKKLLAEGGLLSYFRARALRRMSRKTQSEAPGPVSTELPEPYIRHFPLYPLQGEEGEVLLPRRAAVMSAVEQFKRWREMKQDGSLAVIGEKGMGKTTFLALLERELDDIQVTRHTLSRKMRSTKMLLEDLGEALGLEQPKNTGALARFLNDGPERVVLLDEAHNVFLRAVDGFEPVDSLVSLVDFTSEKVFWVLVFNKYAWAFLTKADKRVLSLRKQLRLPSWSQGDLQELVAARNRRSGIAVEFDEVLLDDITGSAGGFELINSAEGFFRLLYETSRGNPRTATYLWLRSLTRISEDRLRAGLIREESPEAISKLDAELLFALASTAQHENLSVNELHQALNISLDEAAQAARYLVENGILEPKHSDPRRMTLAPRFHHQVLRVLRDKNLLYLED